MKRLFKYIQKAVIQLTVVIFVFAGNMAKAQYPYEFSFAGIPQTDKTIVRSYTPELAVVYYEEGGKGFVSLVNVISNSAITVPLDTGVFMNDMCIMNDSVFLCGQRFFSSVNVGSMVTMNLNNFASGSVLVTYFEPSYWVRLNLKRIKGFEHMIVANIHYTKFLMVCDIEYPCDGSEPFPLYDFNHPYYLDVNNHSMCVVNAVLEVSYPFVPVISGNPLIQKVIRVTNPLNHSEVIHDVVVTDNYVAFVGIETGTTNAITLHICSKGNNILNNTYGSNCFNYYYTYSFGTSSGTPFYHACALDGDKIAIVTQDEMSASSTDITVRTFDLPTHTMINTQNLQCNAHPELKDVAYLPDLQKLVLLYNGYFRLTGNYCDIFCTVDPYNTSPSYLLPGITDNVFHFKFGSLDAMVGKYFISTGGKYGFVSDAGSFNTGRICYDVEDYIIVKTGVINADIGSFDYDRIFPNPNGELVDTVSVQVEIPFQCIDNN